MGIFLCTAPKKPPRGSFNSPFGGFISAISGNPFSWLSPRDWWVIYGRIEFYKCRSTQINILASFFVKDKFDR
jgi:hypothetical protein